MVFGPGQYEVPRVPYVRLGSVYNVATQLVATDGVRAPVGSCAPNKHVCVCRTDKAREIKEQKMWTLKICEPLLIWPNGKAGKQKTTVQYRFGSPFSSERLCFVDSVLRLCSSQLIRNIKTRSAGVILAVTLTV